MDVSGDVADLMVKEGIQLTEASIKLLAAGGKNLAAFLWALSRDSKKLVGKTNMARLLRENKELKVFHIKETDLPEFRSFAKKNVLFSVIKDTRRTDGIVDLVTNTDFVSQVNLFMERRGYGVPTREQEDGTPKKGEPRAQPDNSSPQRGSGSTASQTRTRPMRTTRTTEEKEAKPSVKAKLETYRAELSKSPAQPSQQRTRPVKPKTR